MDRFSPPAARRHWYVHVLVWILPLLLVVWLTYAQFAGRHHWLRQYFAGANTYNTYLGWPVIFAYREPGLPWHEFRMVQASAWPISIDAGCTLLMAAAAAWLLNRWRRRPGALLQWRLPNLFALVALVAALMGCLQVEAALIRASPLTDPWLHRPVRYSPIAWFPPPARAALLAGLAVTLYAAASLVLRYARFPLRRRPLSPPSESPRLPSQ